MLFIEQHVVRQLLNRNSRLPIADSKLDVPKAYSRNRRTAKPELLREEKRVKREERERKNVAVLLLGHAAMHYETKNVYAEPKLRSKHEESFLA